MKRLAKSWPAAFSRPGGQGQGTADVAETPVIHFCTICAKVQHLQRLEKRTLGFLREDRRCKQREDAAAGRARPASEARIEQKQGIAEWRQWTQRRLASDMRCNW